MAVTDYLAAFSFDEGSGTTSADLTGNHGPADLSDPGASWGTGVRGSAVRLQDVDEVGIPVDFDFSGGYTVTFWFRTAQSASNQELLRAGPESGPWQSLVFEAWGDNNMYLGHQDGSGNYHQIGAGNYTGNVWRFFAVSWHATGQLRAWVGTESSAVSLAGSASSVPAPANASGVEAVYLGGNPGQNSINIVDGLVDELAIFDRVLSESELNDLRVNGFGGAAQDLTGTLLTVTPTFPGGTVGRGAVNLDGTALAVTPTFPGGEVQATAPAQELAGHHLSVPVSFPQGETSQVYGIHGTLLEASPTFPGGTVDRGPVTVAGSRLAVSPVFPGGAVSPGAVTLSGTPLTADVGFPRGRVHRVVVHPDGPATVTVDPIPPAEVAPDILVGTAEYAEVDAIPPAEVAPDILVGTAEYA